MELPIDYSKRPFREKYLVDETPVLNAWCVFGEHVDGGVFITDGTNDIFERVPVDVAERIVAAREVFIRAVLEELNGA